MRDIWSFLLQTLTVSGVAVLLLVVKAMFRDKLSPRWQFSVWGVLGLVLLVPAGIGGRYVLVNWLLGIETAKSLLTGEYGSLIRVSAPIPLLPQGRFPTTVAQWLFVLYLTGVVCLLARYMASYICLRQALRRGTPVSMEKAEQIRAVAEQYGLPVCPADEKILLHELLHLQYRDAVWGLVICIFRCIHWCNPLLWYCADQAGNDLESLCDQRVLERLEGEARRDYGHILLSMADEKYARTPGTSSMANGGKNIRRRIQAIARFKRYPAGMALVSVCVMLVLAVPSLLGVQAQTVCEGDSFPQQLKLSVTMASARTVRCTTPAGAVDAYGKAVLTENPVYRAMCAPLGEQNALANAWQQAVDCGASNVLWNFGLSYQTNVQSGYAVYNFAPTDDGYEGVLVVELIWLEEDSEQAEREEEIETAGCWLGVQKISVRQQDRRWIVVPQESFQTIHTNWTGLPLFGCEQLPAYLYEAQAGDFIIQLKYQTIFTVDSFVSNQNLFFPNSDYSTIPQPDAQFSASDWQTVYAIYTGEAAEKGAISHVGIFCAPIWEDGSHPKLQDLNALDSSGSSSDGTIWGNKILRGNDWKDKIAVCDGGRSGSPNAFTYPAGYIARFYVSGKSPIELTLLPVTEGGHFQRKAWS